MDPDDMMGVLIGFLVLVGIASSIGAIVFFFLRARTGEPVSVSLRLLFKFYLYIISIAGLLVLVGGLSHLLKAGFGAILQEDFSYYPVYVASLEPARILKIPPATPEPASTPTPEDLEEERRQQEERREKGLDRALKEGLLRGISMTVVGGIIWGVHVWGRRRLESEEEQDNIFNRVYLILLLVIFGIITLTSLPTAVFETLRFYILESGEEKGFRSTPGGKLSTALVALPIWLFYLRATLLAVRGGGEKAR